MVPLQAYLPRLRHAAAGELPPVLDRVGRRHDLQGDLQGDQAARDRSPDVLHQRNERIVSEKHMLLILHTIYLKI